MHLPRSIFVISLLACGCQGLEPIDLTKGQGQGGTDTGGANVVQLGDLRIEPATLSFGVVGLEDVVGETVVGRRSTPLVLEVLVATLRRDGTLAATTNPAKLIIKLIIQKLF